jgi:uncharacterized repeat protein (TIGR03803 family)
MKHCSLVLLAVSLIALDLYSPSKSRAQTYTESVLYSFAETPSGTAAPGKLVMDSAGNLYGTSLTSGPRVKNCAESCGTIFELSAKGVFSTLYQFGGGAI